MRLCMFHPNDNPMERGWVGRIDGERVLHLAAQTLQSFFLGGGGAREHAEYRLDDVTLLVPVLYPPAVRVFDAPGVFHFANPTSVLGPAQPVTPPPGTRSLTLVPRAAAVIGADEAIGGFTLFADWRAPGRPDPKDRDFGSTLGPVVVTVDELDGEALPVTVRVDGEDRLAGSLEGFAWATARALAAAGTQLRPGDVLATPPLGELENVSAGAGVEIDAPGIGVLRTTIGRG